jgi:uncharacterized protein (DUF2267 family)
MRHKPVTLLAENLEHGTWNVELPTEGRLMSATGLEVFDRTVQKTNSWLFDLNQVLEWPEKHKAYLAFRATLHALRDRMSVEEVAHLGAQLPMLIRGFYYEGWDPSNKPTKERHKEQFLAHIDQQFQNDHSVDPEVVARAVFFVLEQRVSDGEIEDIKHILPEELRSLWP